MKDLNTILSEVATANMKSDYWLNFDLREQKQSPLPRRSEIARSLYPECDSLKIEITASSRTEMQRTLNNRLAHQKEAQRIMSAIIGKTAESGNEYFLLNAPDECHPTPAIFWNFWYLIINRSNNIAIGISCAACD